jgi:hypothetical protein
MRRFGGRLAAALILLLPTAHAWARGGGGGGGFGSGGFGGGGFGGGLHGGTGNGRWDGGASYWLGLLATMAAAVLVYALSEWVRKARAAHTAPHGQIRINIVATLDRGAHYIPALRALAARSRFGTPTGRAKARDSLAALIVPEDVRGGFLRSAPGRGDACQVGQQARELWEHQMRLAEITPEVLVVSSPDEKVQRREHLARREGVGVCMVGVVMTVPAASSLADGGRDEAREALRRLGRTSGEAFYFYYAPGTGEALDLSEADALLARLRLGK